MAEIILKPNREKSVLRRHPWIYSGAIAEVIGSPELGETVIVRDANGAFLSTGAYSPQSQIRVRIWTWDEREEISPEFFTNKLSRAIGIRAQLPDLRNTNAYRLVHGESDGIPGLVLDRYNDTLVAQFLSSGTEIWRETIIQCLNR